MNKTIAIVAGRSGGHLIPGIMYARRYAADADCLFFSTDTTLDHSITNLFKQELIPLSMIGLPGKKIWLYPKFIYQCLASFFISFKYLRRTRAERVVSMGGYISLPVCLAAWFLGIPIDLFELNAEPGKAIAWLTPLATRVLVCFDEARSFFPATKVQNSPYPLRFHPTDSVDKEVACAKLGIDPTKKVIVVLGGSQGSHTLNQLIPDAVKDKDLVVIHQAGSQAVEIKKKYDDQGTQAKVFTYLHELQYVYSAADLVIARSGAGTIFELLFFQKKALLVPLEVASTDHQVANAYAAVKKRPDLFTVVRQNPAGQIKIAIESGSSNKGKAKKAL